MELGEAIKSLKPADRLKGFLVLAVLTSVTAIATVYLKTDDCKGMAEQYQNLVKNNTETMKTNNELLQDLNQKTRAIMHLDSILTAMSNARPLIASKVEVSGGNEVAHTSHSSIIADDTSSVQVLAMESMPEPQIEPVIIKKSTTITEMSAEQKTMLNEALTITKQFKKKQ